MIRLAELTAPGAARLARDPKAVVILPLGAIEQHGPHLPLLVDWRGAEELARRVAPRLARAGWRPVLAPPIPYGVSTLAIGWPGTVSLSVPTVRQHDSPEAVAREAGDHLDDETPERSGRPGSPQGDRRRGAS